MSPGARISSSRGILCHISHLTEWRVSGRVNTCIRLCSAEGSEGLHRGGPRSPISLHSLPPEELG